MSDTFKVFDHELFKSHLAPILSGEEKEVTIEVLHDSGPVEILTHMDTGPDGRPNLISVVRDITERKEAERLKLSSVSTVSHELRTSLTSIKGALRLIESGALGELAPEIDRMVSVAHRNSDRLLDLVNDILALQKIESGEMDFNATALDLNDLLREAAEANAGYGEQFGVTFEVAPQPFSAMVSADPARLMQVMSNLMSNAAKFSPSDGAVPDVYRGPRCNLAGLRERQRPRHPRCGAENHFRQLLSGRKHQRAFSPRHRSWSDNLEKDHPASWRQNRLRNGDRLRHDILLRPEKEHTTFVDHG